MWEARLFNTLRLAFCVNGFKLLSQLALKGGKGMSPEVSRQR